MREIFLCSVQTDLATGDKVVSNSGPMFYLYSVRRQTRFIPTAVGNQQVDIEFTTLDTIPDNQSFIFDGEYYSVINKSSAGFNTMAKYLAVRLNK